MLPESTVPLPVFPVPALGPALPEIVLAVGALVLVLVGAFRGERSTSLVSAGAIGLMLVALALVFFAPAETEVTFFGAFVNDAFARFFKVLVLIGSIVALMMSHDHFRRLGIDRFEYPILIVLATIGMMVMISAGDLIALYMGLELQSLAAYVIASIHRDDGRSTEAGLKYFVLGALSSGLLLYGASLIYGFTGTVSFEGIQLFLADGASTGVIFGLVFLSAGIAFKISAVPFHMWTPDVYEGAPTPVTAFFASAPKMAAMALAIRVFMDAFPTIVDEWQQIVIFISLASVILGSFAAIGQTNIKRLMAYSSIGNIGFALIGLAAGTEAGVQGVLIYMAIYLVLTLGGFACILGMRRGGIVLEDIRDLAGIRRNHPGLAFCLAAVVLSLAGIPPLAGFFAKLYVFLPAIEAGLTLLAVIAIVASVPGAFYYLRVVKIMYFDEPVEAYDPMPAPLGGVMIATSVFNLVFWLVPAPLFAAALIAARSLS
ncbi:NADH-quinone oxidoreductase subunit NuoN [Salinarimonas ramus]|uniref:NADH-quinone oxidoreductase subunit N n=1 Tax=Salinarimonas ramus TaxID=690164 RepID=A0A917QJ89_9HYPH|nr:NADH-quinone oxidoreductase subunit NuoN [Salinarimonas ramus]GGK53222.1 NADH-quinone oxidoreductase subunit N [Salinarimonas ramus]